MLTLQLPKQLNSFNIIIYSWDYNITIVRKLNCLYNVADILITTQDFLASYTVTVVLPPIFQIKILDFDRQHSSIHKPFPSDRKTKKIHQSNNDCTQLYMYSYTSIFNFNYVCVHSSENVRNLGTNNSLFGRLCDIEKQLIVWSVGLLVVCVPCLLVCLFV